MVSGTGRCSVSNPSNFFNDFESAKGEAKRRSESSFQLKVIKRYFSNMVEKEVLNDIWFDNAVEDKLEEVKFKSGDALFGKIYIKKYKLLAMGRIYKNLPSTELWKDMMKYLGERGEAGIVFPILRFGMHILHNFGPQPDAVLKKPKIIWPGNSGIDLTLQEMGVFLKEYKIGE